jgi:hypothetical protein
MNGDGCSDDEDEEEVRSSHSRGSARSDAAPEGALVLNEDSMDSDRGGALNLVRFYLWNYIHLFSLPRRPDWNFKLNPSPRIHKKQIGAFERVELFTSFFSLSSPAALT